MLELIADLKQCLYCWLLSQKGQFRSGKVSVEKMEEPIDFVVTWVDGADAEWRALKQAYEKQSGMERVRQNNGDERYRNWDLFRYWFRAVERYAPWVRNVYLITCGHVPEWLNLNCPKLKVVSHADYIPAENLPTFNSIAIELNMHRIGELSEHFVYFNDDVFLMRPCQPEDFFRGGRPNHCAIAIPLRNEDNSAFYHQQFAILGAINSVFGGRLGQIAAKHPEKWFSKAYGEWRLYNKRAVETEYLPGMFFSHVAVPMKKSTFEKVWDAFPKQLQEASSHRFRRPEDVMHQIMSIWEMMNGDFNAVSMEHPGRVFSSPASQMDQILDAVGGEKYLSICINDSEYVSHEAYLRLKEQISERMESVFPQKSSFEK